MEPLADPQSAKIPCVLVVTATVCGMEGVFSSLFLFGTWLSCFLKDANLSKLLLDATHRDRSIHIERACSLHDMKMT